MINFEHISARWQTLAGEWGLSRQRHRKTLYILPLAGNLLGVVVEDFKFVSYERVPWEDNGTPEAIAMALQQLEEKGIRQKRRVLLVNQPSCRMVRKRFPDMTEEELKESMYWEEDRLFYTGEAMALGYRVLSHSPEGYDTVLFAWPRAEMEIWTEAARQCKKSWAAVCPVMDIQVTDRPYFALYGCKEKGTLLFRSHQEIRSRRVSIKEESAFFLQTMMEQQEIKEADVFLFPMSDCDREEIENWQAWLEESVGSLSEEGKEIHLEIPTIGTEADPFWPLCQPLLLRGDACGVLFPQAHELQVPFFCQENRTLRLAQGAALAAGLFLLYAGGQTISLTLQQKKVESESVALQPEREQMRAVQQERSRIEEKLNHLKTVEKQDPHWEQKLVQLAETVPQGVVLSEIKAERETVQITGTATAAAAVPSFEKRLRTAWGGEVRLVKRKTSMRTGLLEFTVEWKNSSQ